MTGATHREWPGFYIEKAIPTVYQWIWHVSVVCGIGAGLYYGVPERWFTSDWVKRYPFEKAGYCILTSLYCAALGCPLGLACGLLNWGYYVIRGWEDSHPVLGWIITGTGLSMLIGLVTAIRTSRRPLFMIVIRFTWVRFWQLPRWEQIKIVPVIAFMAIMAAVTTYYPLYYFLYWISGFPNTFPPGSLAFETLGATDDALRRHHGTWALVGSLMTFITVCWLGPRLCAEEWHLLYWKKDAADKTCAS